MLGVSGTLLVTGGEVGGRTSLCDKPAPKPDPRDPEAPPIVAPGCGEHAEQRLQRSGLARAAGRASP